MKLRERRDLKRQEAIDRQVRYDNLTTQEKVELAQSRRGGSKKELARLARKEK